MDTKALAKSKRAHSQHHKNKLHSHQKLKGPVVASENAGSKEKQPGKQVRPGTRESRHLSRLPSNWDRYEDEFDLDSADPSGDSTGQASDVVVAKSKGADYSHLIAEAQSQTWSYSDAFPSLDDVMPGGFTQGMGSLLSVKGEGILSWVGDDNFIVEDKATASEEASFLSLNLNGLAEQLAKVDLSERLFVEADLLPLELDAEVSTASSHQESGQMMTKHESEAAVDISRDIDIVFGDFSGGEKESMVPKVEAAMSSNQMPALLNQAKDDLHSNQYDKFGPSKGLQPTTRFNENAVALPQNLPKFEAAAAEAELDTLLDSFRETKFLDSFGSKSSNVFSVSREARSRNPPKVSSGGLDLSGKVHVAANLDDVLDDLLEETSNLTKHNGLSQPINVEVNPQEKQSSSSQSISKSEMLDDFDSWLDTI